MDSAEAWAQWWESHPDVLPAEFVREIVRAKGKADADLCSWGEDRLEVRAHADDVPEPPEESCPA